MPSWPFRFLHASDLHLETPLGGLAIGPDLLPASWLDAPFAAAERVFDAALAHEVDFVLLVGHVLDATRTGPRGPLFLVNQFRRLAESEITVYWAGGDLDGPDQWPNMIGLPENVHHFATGRPEEVIHHRQSAAVARILGTSRGTRRDIRTTDFAPDPGGLFTLAAVHGQIDVEAMAKRRLQYWALGGSHHSETPLEGPTTAHWPGMPQARSPVGPQQAGATLVAVDENGLVTLEPFPTEVVQYRTEPLEATGARCEDDLVAIIRKCSDAMGMQVACDLAVTWRAEVRPEMASVLRQGDALQQVIARANTLPDDRRPRVLTAGLRAEPAGELSPQRFQEKTILGDFLRRLRHLELNDDEPIDLEPYVADKHLAGTLSGAATDVDGELRRDLLEQAARLGAELLHPEEEPA